MDLWHVEKVKDIDRCKGCKHFYQHYIKTWNGYEKTGAGHCTYPRTKGRTSETKACEYFERRKKY